MFLELQIFIFSSLPLPSDVLPFFSLLLYNICMFRCNWLQSLVAFKEPSCSCCPTSHDKVWLEHEAKSRVACIQPTHTSIPYLPVSFPSSSACAASSLYDVQEFHCFLVAHARELLPPSSFQVCISAPRFMSQETDFLANHQGSALDC